MLSYKKCIYIVLCAIGLFIGFHFITWTWFTQKILSGNNNGDLARLAYFPEVKQVRSFSVDLPRKHTELSEFKGGNVDVLTIGDSFSNGIGGGRNRYYQDYLATIQNLDVVNVRPYGFDSADPGNPFDTLTLLLNSGVVDDIKPKIILLESAERFICNRTTKINFTITENKKKIVEYYFDNKLHVSDLLPKMTFINDGNLKYYTYTHKRKSGEHLLNGVVITKLNRKLFNNGSDDTLLFLVDDLKGMSKDYEACASGLNEKLNMLASSLNRKGIKLYFMLAVDKYNLYSGYIDNNMFAKSRIFELLRGMDKTYSFVDTKKILGNELDKNGTSDLFYLDDSHWSWKASEVIFSTVAVQ